MRKSKSPYCMATPKVFRRKKCGGRIDRELLLVNSTLTDFSEKAIKEAKFAMEDEKGDKIRIKSKGGCRFIVGRNSYTS